MDLEQLFARESERVLAERSDVEQGKMFSAVGLKTGGKFFAMAVRGDLVLKLPAERIDELEREGAAEHWDRGDGRPLREWAVLRPPDREALAGYVEEARVFVAGLGP